MTTVTVPLRRADWRYLLPMAPARRYEHLVLFGGPDGLAERLRETGMARRITTEAPTAPADAVVVLRGARLSPARAAAYVAPGGVYYCEVDRRRLATIGQTPTRVQRAVRNAGLLPIGTYWVIPDFHHARRYLPLDSDEALAWYFSTLQTAGSLAALVAEAGVRAAAGRAWRGVARWVPCFGIVAVRGERSRIPSVLGDPAAPTDTGSAGQSVAVLTSGQDDGSRVVLLPFAPGRSEPTVVMKATRTSAFNGHTEREQFTLHQLRAQLDSEMRETIPAPLGTYRYDNLLVGMESYAGGRAVVVTSGRWGAPPEQAISDLSVTAEWLARFHEQARCRLRRWDEGLAEHVERRLDAYRRSFAPVGDEARLLMLARERSGLLGAHVVPSVWLHNDFAPWNVHRAGSRVAVIDWELGGEGEGHRIGPPLCDLVYFVTYWYQRARHLRGDAGMLRGMREVFLERQADHPLVMAARECLQTYLQRLGIDRRFYPLLLVYTWVDRALDRADRTLDPSANRHRESVRLLATEAEHLFHASEAP